MYGRNRKCNGKVEVTFSDDRRKHGRLDPPDRVLHWGLAKAGGDRQ